MPLGWPCSQRIEEARRPRPEPTNGQAIAMPVLRFGLFGATRVSCKSHVLKIYWTKWPNSRCRRPACRQRRLLVMLACVASCQLILNPSPPGRMPGGRAGRRPASQPAPHRRMTNLSGIGRDACRPRKPEARVPISAAKQILPRGRRTSTSSRREIAALSQPGGFGLVRRSKCAIGAACLRPKVRHSSLV
jgi:hypothetical protein